jgi:RimJ/RimL family protein N-acetyltransferase
MSRPSGGQVEIGYGTITEFQGRGYATEAVSALTAWALSQPEVSVVVADALPANRASVRVLERAGFAEAGPGEEEGTRRFECAAP